ncbi:MAG TPA: sodium:proton antiporter [Acidobacteriota bacterium]|nr:sodium:proton antiporter [Acidobacteriota bacterium]
MSENLLFGLTLIVFLGLLAQWLAWRLHLPSILLLLVFGFVAGPVTNMMDPDLMLGDTLFPIVSISVALILFEGGMSLHLSELKEIHRPVRKILTWGAMITWLLTALSAHWIVHLNWTLSILLGAVLVVTGPTVVGPLLRHVRPTSKVASIARWEGILIDPVGAVLALLIFEAILAGAEDATGTAAIHFLQTFGIGILVGVAGAGFIVMMLKNYWIPDFLHNSFALAAVVSAFTASNLVMHESGLVTVTVMGLALANQKWTPVEHIIAFKEDLRVLLISGLFILLSARLKLETLAELGSSSVLFVAFLVLIVRPASVYGSLWRTKLNWREKLFLSWLAPRGIVAAAVASIFSIRLVDAGFAEASALVPLTFIVIVATAAIYGLTAKPLARSLGVAQEHPRGFLIVGAHPWARRIGQILHEQNLPVMLVDSNWSNVSEAKKLGLPAHYANILAEHIEDELELEGIGRLLALTANDEANSLACLHFRDIFGRSSVYQIPAHPKARSDTLSMPKHLRGRVLFGEEATYAALNRLLGEPDMVLKATRLSEEFGYEDYLHLYGSDATPMFAIREDGSVKVVTVDDPLDPRPGTLIIGAVSKDKQRPQQKTRPDLQEQARDEARREVERRKREASE